MPFTSDDVAAFAKREHAHRTRLAGLMTLVLALALIVLPTFKSQITSTTSDSRLLGLRDLCGWERDDCPTDPNIAKPGVCGCGVPDTDTDGDGTPDCKDGCPHDASKTNYNVCGCGVPDTDTDGDGTPDCRDRCPRDAASTSPSICGCGFLDTDADGDGTPDCRSDCIDNDPYILSICEANGGYDCEGCGGKYIRLWKECGLMCLSDIDYCLDYSEEVFVVYDSLQDYQIQSYYWKMIQTGADSSNSILEFWLDCELVAECAVYYYMNGVPCSETYNDTADCLVCDDGNEYCNEKGILPLPSNPWFGFDGEAQYLVSACFGWDIPTTSEFEMKPLGNKLSQYARAFFNHHGA